MIAVGVEPTTIALKVRCSTTELRDHIHTISWTVKGYRSRVEKLSILRRSRHSTLYVYHLREVDAYHVMYTRK